MNDDYHLEELPHGFMIKSRRWLPLKVTRTATGFHVPLRRSDPQMRLFPDEEAVYRQPGFFCCFLEPRYLASHVVSALHVVSEVEGDESRSKYWIRAEDYDETRRMMAAPVIAQFHRLRSQADPTVLAVQNAAFAATLKDCWLLHEPGLYQQPYFVRDMLTYRAAASLPLLASELLQGRGIFRGDDDLGTVPDKVVSALTDWQRWYSYSDQSYRTLRRTLMNLPGGIPPELLIQLANVELERPITDRVELLAVLYGQQLVGFGDDESMNSCQRILMHSTRAEIEAGMAAVSEEIHDRLTSRNSKHVERFVYFLSHVREVPRGRLPGLTRRAIRRHRDMESVEVDEVLDSLGGGTPTKYPPIPLPKDPRVTFLDTVGAICDEARHMGHCVARYAERAVAGGCFLFHVQHGEQGATIEVGQDGEVRQAFGPKNCQNRACRIGTRLLEAWGAGLSRDLPTEFQRSAG